MKMKTVALPGNNSDQLMPPLIISKRLSCYTILTPTNLYFSLAIQRLKSFSCAFKIDFN